MNNQELAQLLTEALSELGEIPIALKYFSACQNSIAKIATVRTELLKNNGMVSKEEND